MEREGERERERGRKKVGEIGWGMGFNFKVASFPVCHMLTLTPHDDNVTTRRNCHRLLRGSCVMSTISSHADIRSPHSDNGMSR